MMRRWTDMLTRDERLLLTEKYDGVPQARFEHDRKRLACGEPLAYVIGFVPFLDCVINMSERPHIPRPETEFWVADAMRRMRHDARTTIHCLDMFAGSGCIGIALLKHLPNTVVDFVDCSKRCVRQIENNLLLNGIEPHRFRVLRSDLFAQVSPCTYDYVFANPPYLSRYRLSRIAPSVLAYEPHRSLFGGGREGVNLLSRFLREVKKFLAPEGVIVMEFDDIQFENVQRCAVQNEFPSVTFEKDHYGAFRFVYLSVGENAHALH